MLQTIQRAFVVKLFRVLSYSLLLMAVFISFWLDSSRSGGCPNSMGCMGAGIGNAVQWLLVVVPTTFVCAILNLVSYFALPRPRTRTRTLEVIVFACPFLALVAVFIRFLS